MVVSADHPNEGNGEAAGSFRRRSLDGANFARKRCRAVTVSASDPTIDLKRERPYASALGRAYAGALVFDIPLLMTMEMWLQGVAMDRWRRLAFMVASFPSVFGLASYAGLSKTGGPAPAGWTPSRLSTLTARIAQAAETATGNVFRGFKHGDDTASAVDVEGVVGEGEEVSPVTIDAVPGHGHADGPPQFDADPRAAALRVRGWTAP